MGTGSVGRELDLEPFVSDLQLRYGDAVNANFSSDAMVTVRLEENGPAYTIYRTGSFQIRGLRLKRTWLRQRNDSVKH